MTRDYLAIFRSWTNTMEDRLVADIKKDLGSGTFSLSDLARNLHEKVSMSGGVSHSSLLLLSSGQLRTQSGQLAQPQVRPQRSPYQYLQQTCLWYHEGFRPREKGISLHSCGAGYYEESFMIKTTS